jgi:hypothetical protein
MCSSLLQHLTRTWLVITAAVLVASLRQAAAQADPPGRLNYEMVVIVPVTRSQGWRATLYDAAADPIEAAPGRTAIGRRGSSPGSATSNVRTIRAR